MTNIIDELKSVTRDFYCIVYRYKKELHYLQRNNKPLLFYDYEQAKMYFDVNELDTMNDSLLFWRIGNLIYPEIYIVKVTLSNFELVIGE